jgi:hypothetical protein
MHLHLEEMQRGMSSPKHLRKFAAESVSDLFMSAAGSLS